MRNSYITKKGYIPGNITIQTWFSFLLQHGVRPYQSVLNDQIHEQNIGFFLTSEKSGKKFDATGKPRYWGENDFLKCYFTNSLNPSSSLFYEKWLSFTRYKA